MQTKEDRQQAELLALETKYKVYATRFKKMERAIQIEKEEQRSTRELREKLKEREDELKALQDQIRGGN
jgi:hypothetical protein